MSARTNEFLYDTLIFNKEVIKSDSNWFIVNEQDKIFRVKDNYRAVFKKYVNELREGTKKSNNYYNYLVYKGNDIVGNIVAYYDEKSELTVEVYL